MKHETAGDPITGLKWTRKTTRKIAQALGEVGIQVSANTVARLLKEMKFSLRVNHKKIESGIRNPPKPSVRNRQFEYIRAARERFADRRNPVISVDTKKKELIGNFSNPGRTWEQEPVEVYDHDFRCDAAGIAVPYGVYDTEQKIGYMFVGTSHDTPAFAVDCLQRWWTIYGRKAYPTAAELLILADCGGSNSYRCRAWKWRIQKMLCEGHGLTVTVCHYPPGSSKWNPVEHQLFCRITANWQGTPLQNLETMLKYIRTTRTEAGLTVRARPIQKKYENGEKIPDKEIKGLSLTRHKTFPEWNYTLMPAKMRSCF